MRLLVAVETLGSILSERSIGPISRPPAMPSAPASIPAMNTIKLYWMYVEWVNLKSIGTLFLK